jgi:hypothetical protein
MPGIGKADYPELVPSKAFEIVERVGRESVKTGNGLASVMGLKSPDSGYFYHQVSSLTKYYGLIDRTKGTVALTPLGERIAHPLSEEDKRQAQGEAVRRVGLIAALFDRLGTEFHAADFRTTLRDITQAPLAEIEKTGGEVEALYKDAQRYLIPSGPGRNTTERAESASAAGPKTVTESHGMQRSDTMFSPEPGYRVFHGDGVYVKIKKDKDALEEALTTIQGWLKRHSESEASSKRSDQGDG